MEILDNDKKIFEYLNPIENIKLTELGNSDKLNIMFELKNYYLELRNTLGLSQDATFGLEMEFENAERDIIEESLLKIFPCSDWKVVNDLSLYNGGEINSPIFSDNDKSWIDLSMVCDIVSKNAFVLDNTSAHIHVGMHILGGNPKYWGNFVKLWMAYENVIFRFLYGEYVSPRNRILEFAKPVAKDWIKKLETGRIDDRANMHTAHYMFRLLNTGENTIERRRKSVNFENISNVESYKYNYEGFMRTIEFRGANGTFNPVIWQNNVNLLVHLFMYAKSDSFDEDKILRRIKWLNDEEIPSDIRKYSRIYNDQVMELADLIFNNNLDKVYFLRQYYKDGNVSNKAMFKSGEFTKRRYK